ncbi:MAG: DUF2703 domain-containing protein [Planctomycetota bacterium]
MKRFSAAAFALLLAVGWTGCETMSRRGDATRTLTIRWQRLVDEEGRTCGRCGSTEKEVRQGVRTLRQSLAVVGIEVLLEEKSVDTATFAKDTSQSNRIWVGDRPLEEWLGAEVGMSPCEGCCPVTGGSVDCRTLRLDGREYEIIPAALIIRAGFLAAAGLIPGDACGGRCPEPSPGGCCPESDCGPR